MTLTELNAAWQDLRTAALGRSGLDENVSAGLASRIAQALEGWGRFYASAGYGSDFFGSSHPEVAAWLERYRVLAFDARREGLRFAEFGDTSGEQLSEAASTVASATGHALFSVGLLATALAGLYLVIKGRR